MKPAKTKPATCPACGAATVLRCTYGSHHQGPPLEPDEIMCGGDVLRGDEAAWYCDACKHSWGRNHD